MLTSSQIVDLSAEMPTDAYKSLQSQIGFGVACLIKRFFAFT
jgi:hypothetical protein